MTSLAVLWVALAGCRPDPTPGAAVVTFDDELPTVAHVTWTSDEAGTGFVRFVDPDGVEHATAEETTASSSHAVSVLGLAATETYELVAVTRVGGEELAHEPVTVGLPPAPSTVPEGFVTGDGDGWVLTHTAGMDNDAAVIYDRRGRPVWYLPMEDGRRLFTTVLDTEGSLWLLANFDDFIRTEGQIHHLALDGSFHDTTPIERAHSAVVPLPDGGAAYVVKQLEWWNEGWLLWDTIEEMAPDGSTRVVFDFREAFTPEPLCEHWYFSPAEDPDTAYFDWTHVNSLLLSDDGSAYYAMVRNFDALVKIDRATGELLWVLGGPYGEFTFDQPTSMFSHAHTSWVTDGRMLVHDNALHGDPPVSRVVEYVFDEDTRAVTRVRQVEDLEGRRVDWLGDVKDAADGGMIASWSTFGQIQEFDAAGDLRWELATTLGFGTGRTTWLPTLDPATAGP